MWKKSNKHLSRDADEYQIFLPFSTVVAVVNLQGAFLRIFYSSFPLIFINMISLGATYNFILFYFMLCYFILLCASTLSYLTQLLKVTCNGEWCDVIDRKKLWLVSTNGGRTHWSRDPVAHPCTIRVVLVIWVVRKYFK